MLNENSRKAKEEINKFKKKNDGDEDKCLISLIRSCVSAVRILVSLSLLFWCDGIVAIFFFQHFSENFDEVAGFGQHGL